jgi:hypothetical protein
MGIHGPSKGFAGLSICCVENIFGFVRSLGTLSDSGRGNSDARKYSAGPGSGFVQRADMHPLPEKTMPDGL